MPRLGILVPTMGRSDRISKVFNNITDNTQTSHKVYFIIEPEDQDTKEAVESLESDKAVIVINKDPHTYVSAINTGFEESKEPFVFCASDDLEFSSSWDVDLMEKLKLYGFVGVKDNWLITKTGKHASHFAVRRDYIENLGGSEGYTGKIYCPLYQHFMCDIETEQTAQKRGQFVVADGFVDHLHWYNKTAQKDETYTKEQPKLKADTDTYRSRRKLFEQYLFEDLFSGKVTPVNQKTLSIFIPNYEALDTLKITIDSLYQNTYHDFELVVVDDASSSDTQKEIKKLSKEYGFTFKPLKKKTYVNPIWNMAGDLTSGDVIAILNNDITFSKYWDVYLMDQFSDPSVYLSNPFQTDPRHRRPYGLNHRTNGLAIRGAGYMMTRESYNAIFPIPHELKIWFGDNWIADRLKHLGKRSVFVEKSVIHHFGSQSSHQFQVRTGEFHQIILNDAHKYQEITGIDTKKWQRIIQRRIERGR